MPLEEQESIFLHNMGHEGLSNSASQEHARHLPIRAVIFDYDGLIVDSEEHWFQSYRNACLPYGTNITEEHWQEILGRGQMTSYIIEKFGLNVERDTLRSRAKGLFRDRTANGSAALPGAVELINELHVAYPLAIASGSATDDVVRGLDHIGVRNSFRVIVGGDSVRTGKPNPEIYLETARQMKVDPMQCLVFEDSLTGLQAAKRASMRCISVPNRFLLNKDFSSADVVVPSLSMINLAIIRQMEQVRSIKLPIES